jgi:exopolyphosphatase/guanosine-5'-triphosphate,3'-diphosphate pyrophosphatase
VERIALVARYHRKSEPKARHPEFAALDEHDQRLVRCLAGLLRIAIGLDRNHAGRVAGVEVAGGDGRLRIVAHPAPGQDISLECYAAASRRQLLEGVLDVTIEVVDGS